MYMYVFVYAVGRSVPLTFMRNIIGFFTMKLSWFRIHWTLSQLRSFWYTFWCSAVVMFLLLFLYVFTCLFILFFVCFCVCWFWASESYGPWGDLVILLEINEALLHSLNKCKLVFNGTSVQDENTIHIILFVFLSDQDHTVSNHWAFN